MGRVSLGRELRKFSLVSCPVSGSFTVVVFSMLSRSQPDRVTMVSYYVTGVGLVFSTSDSQRVILFMANPSVSTNFMNKI